MYVDRSISLRSFSTKLVPFFRTHEGIHLLICWPPNAIRRVHRSKSTPTVDPPPTPALAYGMPANNRFTRFIRLVIVLPFFFSLTRTTILRVRFRQLPVLETQRFGGGSIARLPFPSVGDGARAKRTREFSATGAGMGA